MDLVNIANIKILVALEIGKETFIPMFEHEWAVHDGSFNNHLVRNWMESAQSSGALQHLRIQRLQSARADDSCASAFVGFGSTADGVDVPVRRDHKRVSQTYGAEEDKTVTIEGGLDWMWKDHGADVALSDLHSLTNVYEDSLGAHSGSSNEEHDPPTLGPDIPMMEFQIPTAGHGGKNKVSYRANYAAKRATSSKKPTPYIQNFEQNLIDYGEFPIGYTYPDGQVPAKTS